jgi:hypothetical protein
MAYRFFSHCKGSTGRPSMRSSKYNPVAPVVETDRPSASARDARARWTSMSFEVAVKAERLCAVIDDDQPAEARKASAPITPS